MGAMAAPTNRAFAPMSNPHPGPPPTWGRENHLARGHMRLPCIHPRALRPGGRLSSLRSPSLRNRLRQGFAGLSGKLESGGASAETDLPPQGGKGRFSQRCPSNSTAMPARGRKITRRSAPGRFASRHGTAVTARWSSASRRSPRFGRSGTRRCGCGSGRRAAACYGAAHPRARRCRSAGRRIRHSR